MRTNHLILYIIVLACAFFGFDPKWGYMAGSPWWSHLTFHFTHGNIFHLAANLLVAFLLLLNRKDPWWLWPVCYAVATLCSFCIATSKPTVGLSGILFAYYGILFFKDGVKWKSLRTTIIYMAVSCLFASRMAIGLHLLCLVEGCLIGFFMHLLDDFENKNKLYE